ncbi:hypothetical protein B0J12DRAFT_432562 [Macrophomina phaseolina]|uniref:Uncharacterized protein n=1 Tax=Macrophomina phaseolina TaxID=35725 RepID=A0ABQ8GHY1_9PEZI|nr:hypothetical protein B0J12DRAFT_432562 [Macrophomina phaseolina]
MSNIPEDRCSGSDSGVRLPNHSQNNQGNNSAQPLHTHVGAPSSPPSNIPSFHTQTLSLPPSQIFHNDTPAQQGRAEKFHDARLQDLENVVGGLSYRLGAMDTELASKKLKNEELTQECQELKEELKDTKYELKNVKQDCKDLKQEAKEAKQEHHASLKELKDELRNASNLLHTGSEDRRLLQLNTLRLQNEILMLQGDLRFMLQHPDRLPKPRPGQGLDQTSAQDNLTGAAAQIGAIRQNSTPQSQVIAAGDPDTTPTPSRAVLARINELVQPTASDAPSAAAIPPHAGLRAMASSFDPRPIAQQNNVHFTAPGYGSPAGPLVAHGTNQTLRERASFASFGQFGRLEDPFQPSSPFHAQSQQSLSRPSSMMSMTPSTPSREASSENLRTTPSRARHNNNNNDNAPRAGGGNGGAPPSKALASSNWRRPRAPKPTPPASRSAPTITSLDEARAHYRALLDRIERWADLYCGTIHTSVRSKEARTLELIRTLGGMIGDFDLEKFFTNMELRTLLVAAYLNRRILGRVFGDDVLEWAGAHVAKTVRELTLSGDRAGARDTAKRCEIVGEKAKVLRRAFVGDGEGAVPEWRAVEADALMCEVCGLLEPIVPTAERAAGKEEMMAIVEEAFGVVGAMRGMAPPKEWHMVFDGPGVRVAFASMNVRAVVGGGGVLKTEAAGGENEQVVVVGVTPHLVAKSWSLGGVAPEELLKADVLTHPVGRGSFGHR